MKKNILFLILLLIGFKTVLMAQSGKPTDAKEHWEFANFGANSGGKMKLEKGKLSINTQRTRHAWDESDSYSFAWQKQPFPYDDCSKSTISVNIQKFKIGSAGIMMRSNTTLGAANAHLEVSFTGDVLLMYRKADGEATQYIRIASLAFPMELKMVRQGTVFTGYYKNEKGEWLKGGSVIAGVNADPIVGFYACSGSNSQIGYSDEANENMDVSFSDWNISYEENFIPAEKDFKDKMPVKSGTLLRDNFDDGSLSNGPATVTNPVWDGIKFGNLPIDKAGGRYWRKTGDGTFYLGNKKWADYQVSIDLTFDVTSSKTSEFAMQLRYQNIPVYVLPKYYTVALRDGDKVVFEKFEQGAVSFTKSVTVPRYFDGTKHTLMVKMLDRNYEVYYDNKKLISGVDTEKAITYGNMSLKFINVDMNIDNLEVLKIDDPINGVADNYLQDYYDTPLPSYLKKYGF
jgi:hypothetical protein